jgi:hypothetical protein
VKFITLEDKNFEDYLHTRKGNLKIVKRYNGQSTYAKASVDKKKPTFAKASGNTWWSFSTVAHRRKSLETTGVGSNKKSPPSR